MEIDGTALNGSSPVNPPLADAYDALNIQRIDIDRRMLALNPDDPARETLWQDLDVVLGKLGEVVGRLANSPAAQLSDLRAKAEVLATLLRADEEDAGPILSEAERSALALSLVGDITRLVSR
jgi:hypothetical protein